LTAPRAGAVDGGSRAKSPQDLAAELHASEQRYAALIESAGDGIVSADEEGVITSFNPAAERIFGYSPEQAIGQPLTVLMPERFHDAHRAGLGRFLATGEAQLIGSTVEVTARRKDGREFPLELSLTSWDEDGSTCFTGILRDVTDRKRAESYLATERAVLEVLTRLQGPEEGLPRVLEAIADGTGLELGAVWTLDDERPVLSCAALWHSPTLEAPAFLALSRKTTFPPGTGLPGRVWQSGRPAWIEDVQKDSNFPRLPAAVEDGLHGAIGLPVASGREFVGVIELFSRETRPPDEELLRMLTAIGRQVGDFLRRTKTERELLEFATIVESADDAIIGKTLDGVITSWNPGAERLYRYSANEVIGQPISILIPDDLEDELPGLLERVARGETIDHHDTVRRRKDGTEVQVSVTISPTPDVEGKVTGAAIVAHDISERKVAERVLATTADELERSNKELEKFGAIVAHDLSEPLRVMAGFAQLVQKRYGAELDSGGSELLDAIKAGSDRMQRLIDDLLAYARVGRETAREPVACDELVEEALASLAERRQETGAMVTVDSLPTVDGAPSALGQLFQNLIGNALKFVGDAPPDVHVSAEREEGEWRFSVRDNGLGIDPQHTERIFEPFQRLHPRDAFPGTGIGLAICRRVVEVHGGRIWVEAAPGGGSTFSFTIADDASAPG
jgi:PAS domain S-box-containing protein